MSNWLKKKYTDGEEFFDFLGAFILMALSVVTMFAFAIITLSWASGVCSG